MNISNKCCSLHVFFVLQCQGIIPSLQPTSHLCHLNGTRKILVPICLLQVGAICLQYSHMTLLVSQIFIVLLELKLQVSAVV